MVTPALARAQPSQAPAEPKALNIPFGQLQGQKVEDLDGQKLGTIRDVIVDLNSGAAKYAIVATGGIAKVGSKAKIVPASALSLATSKKRTVALNVPKARWKYAPAFKKRELESLDDPVRALQIRRYYTRSADDIQESERGQKPPGSLSRTSRQSDKNVPSVWQMASTLIGKEIINRKEQSLGEISDVLVDLTEQRPSLIIVTTKKLLKPGPSTTLRLQGSILTSGKLLVRQ